MNPRAIASTIVAALMAAGCSTTARLYPVEGPLSADIKYQAMEAQVSGITGNNGKITLVMPAGESCEGEWSSAAGAGLTLTHASFLTQHDHLWGFGFSKSTGVGQNPGRAILLCNTGRRIEIHFVTGAGTANGHGLGEDSEGNVYRVMF